MEKDLNYWKKNAEEDYMKVPISVLRYITELEKAALPQANVISSADCCDNPDTRIYYENNSNVGGSGIFGVTNQVYKCKNCGKQRLI